LSYSWFQTNQTGGQWYSDTSPFSIPWREINGNWGLSGVCTINYSAQEGVFARHSDLNFEMGFNQILSFC
jgi:hypothetical protein